MQINYPPKINFVVALSAEAHPMIGFFRMKRNHDVKEYELYENERACLIVCGLGKLNAAMAVTYLAGKYGVNESTVWLNVGIAGGDAGAPGDAVVANSIVDAESGQAFYPGLCFNPGMLQSRIITVNKPDVNYLENALYDMEASGFFAAANRFSPSELIHCCKFISDGSKRDIGEIDKQSVINTIQSGLGEIELLVKQILTLAEQIHADERLVELFARLTERYHFSESQKHALRQDLQSYFALTEEPGLDLKELESARTSREVLQKVQRMTGSAPVRY